MYTQNYVFSTKWKLTVNTIYVFITIIFLFKITNTNNIQLIMFNKQLDYFMNQLRVPYLAGGRSSSLESFRPTGRSPNICGSSGGGFGRLPV